MPQAEVSPPLAEPIVATLHGWDVEGVLDTARRLHVKSLKFSLHITLVLMPQWVEATSLMSAMVESRHCISGDAQS